MQPSACNTAEGTEPPHTLRIIRGHGHISGHTYFLSHVSPPPVANRPSKMAASVGIKSAASLRSRTLTAARPSSFGPAPLHRHRAVCKPVRVIEIDLTDPDTQFAVAGVLMVRGSPCSLGPSTLSFGRRPQNNLFIG